MADAQPLTWNAEALWQQLEPQLPGISVEVVARATSTSTSLLERLRQAGGRRAGDSQPCLLVAEHQTQGRGRLGRDWQSSPGRSLTFSLGLPLAPRDWSGLSLAVGVALAEALDPEQRRIVLKWPNDLWLADGPGRGRKLGGVLIETIAAGTHRVAVVGVGLNVLTQEIDGLTSGFACLREIDPGIDAPHALAAVALPLVRALKRFEAEGFAPFAARFGARDLLRGQAVVTLGPEPAEGVADGVDERGGLRLRVDGDLHTLVSGEVSVRLRNPPC
jgi:BirA family transcriptional regulator, biotin operon repressor / biotin---[acetyl-CoA-carboxylase] ligase